HAVDLQVALNALIRHCASGKLLWNETAFEHFVRDRCRNSVDKMLSHLWIVAKCRNNLLLHRCLFACRVLLLLLLQLLASRGLILLDNLVGEFVSNWILAGRLGFHRCLKGSHLHREYSNDGHQNANSVFLHCPRLQFLLSLEFGVWVNLGQGAGCTRSSVSAYLICQPQLKLTDQILVAT